MNKKKHDKLLKKAIQHNQKTRQRQLGKVKEPPIPKTCHINTAKVHSKPEKIMASILAYNDIPFIFQHRLKDSMRRFDFYIQKGVLSDKPVVIEVNGEQHYSIGRGCMGAKMYYTSIESDSFKVRYCKEHNIELIFVDARKSTYTHIIQSTKEIPLLSHLVANLTNKKLSKLLKSYFN